ACQLPKGSAVFSRGAPPRSEEAESCLTTANCPSELRASSAWTFVRFKDVGDDRTPLVLRSWSPQMGLRLRNRGARTRRRGDPVAFRGCPPVPEGGRGGPLNAGARPRVQRALLAEQTLAYQLLP